MWRGRGRERERSFGQSGKVSSRADLSTGGGGGGDEANNGLVSHATKNIGSGGGTPGGHGHGRTRPQLTHWTMQWSHRYRFMRRDELDTDRVTETEGSRRSRSGQGATDRNSRCDCFSLRCPLIGHLFGNSSATDFFSRVIRNALPDKLPSCKDEGVPPLWPGGSVPFVFSRSRWAFLSCAFFCPIR